MNSDTTHATHKTDRLLVLAMGLIGVAVLGLLAVTAYQSFLNSHL